MGRMTRPTVPDTTCFAIDLLRAFVCADPMPVIERLHYCAVDKRRPSSAPQQQQREQFEARASRHRPLGSVSTKYVLM